MRDEDLHPPVTLSCLIRRCRPGCAAFHGILLVKMQRENTFPFLASASPQPSRSEKSCTATHSSLPKLSGGFSSFASLPCSQPIAGSSPLLDPCTSGGLAADTDALTLTTLPSTLPTPICIALKIDRQLYLSLTFSTCCIEHIRGKSSLPAFVLMNIFVQNHVQDELM